MKQAESILAKSDGMACDLPELDAEEVRINALVHELNRAIADGGDAAEIQRVMNQLLLDASSHFEHEERVLSERTYPLRKGHAGLHRQMRAELEHAMEVLRDVEARATWAECGLLVAQLFVEHMRQETMKFRNFLRPDSPSDLQGT